MGGRALVQRGSPLSGECGSTEGPLVQKSHSNLGQGQDFDPDVSHEEALLFSPSGEVWPAVRVGWQSGRPAGSLLPFLQKPGPGDTRGVVLPPLGRRGLRLAELRWKEACLCFFDAHTLWTPGGMPESSLSRQTYLAPFIVPNKSISPGLSHLPPDGCLPAPHFLPLAIQMPALGYPVCCHSSGTGQGSPSPSQSPFTLSYSVPGHPLPSLSSLVLRWPLFSSPVTASPSELPEKGHSALGDATDYRIVHAA